MTYETLRHAADSWGLVFMSVVFLTLIGWTFRPGSRTDHHRAANMIFEARLDEDQDNG
ncbi:MAG: cbb3-type cytochrome c oxidase subunit 3 [Sphingomonadaceae bacterium]